MFSYPYSRRKRSVTGARCTDMSLLAVHVSVACQGCIYYERLTVGVLWLRHLRSAYLSEMRGGLSIAAPPCTLRCLSETGGALNIGPSGDSRVAVPRCQNKEIQSLASTHSHTVFRVSGLGVTFASLHGSRQGELSAFKHIPHLSLL